MTNRGAMDPDPARTPGLECGGGVAPGQTPPDTSQTSGLSAAEPQTSRRFPPTGIGAVAVTIGVVALFAAVAVGLVVLIIG